MKLKLIIVALSFWLFSMADIAYGQIDYALYGDLLNKYVDVEGKVDYKALNDDRLNLDIFVLNLARADLSKYSDDEKKAFWINAFICISTFQP